MVVDLQGIVAFLALQWACFEAMNGDILSLIARFECNPWIYYVYISACVCLEATLTCVWPFARAQRKEFIAARWVFNHSPEYYLHDAIICSNYSGKQRNRAREQYILDFARISFNQVLRFLCSPLAKYGAMSWRVNSHPTRDETAESKTKQSVLKTAPWSP